MESTEPTCSERIAKRYAREINDIRNGICSLGKTEEFLRDYGLSFDYVACGDFNETDPEIPYWRWQLSWGGPQDEFRFPHESKEMVFRQKVKRGEHAWTDPIVNEDIVASLRCEYWFLDWGDGAHVNMNGKDLDMLREVFRYFLHAGAVLDSFTTAEGTPLYIHTYDTK